jgi:C4-dicarboxylate transporter, DctM subunit
MHDGLAERSSLYGTEPCSGMIGMVTPPVGLNLFVASGISGLSLTEVVRASLPWLLLLLAFLMLVTYVPSISLFLPELMIGAPA